MLFMLCLLRHAICPMGYAKSQRAHWWHSLAAAVCGSALCHTVMCHAVLHHAASCYAVLRHAAPAYAESTIRCPAPACINDTDREAAVVLEFVFDSLIASFPGFLQTAWRRAGTPFLKRRQQYEHLPAYNELGMCKESLAFPEKPSCCLADFLVKYVLHHLYAFVHVFHNWVITN